jgi:hypothetical protein
VTLRAPRGASARRDAIAGFQPRLRPVAPMALGNVRAPIEIVSSLTLPGAAEALYERGSAWSASPVIWVRARLAAPPPRLYGAR